MIKYLLLILLFLASCKADNVEIQYPLKIRRVDCQDTTATYYFQQVNGIEEAWFTAPCGLYKVGDSATVTFYTDYVISCNSDTTIAFDTTLPNGGVKLGGIGDNSTTIDTSTIWYKWIPNGEDSTIGIPVDSPYNFQNFK